MFVIFCLLHQKCGHYKRKIINQKQFLLHFHDFSLNNFYLNFRLPILKVLFRAFLPSFLAGWPRCYRKYRFAVTSWSPSSWACVCLTVCLFVSLFGCIFVFVSLSVCLLPCLPLFLFDFQSRCFMDSLFLCSSDIEYIFLMYNTGD